MPSDIRHYLNTAPSIYLKYTFCRNGEEWAQRRKPTQEKMMRPAVVAMYVPLIEKVTNDFVELLRKKGKVDDLLSVMSNYTTESKIVVFCLFFFLSQIKIYI